MCPRSGSNPAVPIRFREFLMARPCSFATSKVEEWRSIDLANLRRWRMLTPGMVARTGKIPGIYWDTPRGREQLGVVAGSTSVWFIKRHDGQLYKLAVPFIFTPTQFGGQRAWFQCPGCRRGCRVLYGTNSLLCRKCRGLVRSLNIKHQPSACSIGPTRSGVASERGATRATRCRQSRATCAGEGTVGLSALWRGWSRRGGPPCRPTLTLSGAGFGFAVPH